MGIYDRDYIFRDKGRVGQIRMFSVNAWLIIINCAVFFIGLLLTSGVPVFIQRAADGPTIRVHGDFLLSADGPRANAQQVRQIGRVLVRDEVDIATNIRVGAGTAIYQVEAPLTAYGHFSTYQGVQQLQFWRLLTFQFLHANITHLFFNMLGLYMFGGMVEQHLGKKRYLAFYLTTGIAGGVAYLLLNVAGMAAARFGIRVPGLLYNDTTVQLVGASAGVFGVIMACAYISPNAVVQLLFPPIPLKLRTMAYLYVGIAAATLLFNGKNAGGEAGHLGGAIAGFILIRRSHLLRDFFDVLGDSRKPKRPTVQHAPSRPREEPGDAEIDRILSKVSTQGLHSLSDGEKEALRRATARKASGGA